MSFLQRLFGLGDASDNLRIIITRHGERADLALGKKWAYDPPLTVDGERQSASIGRKLLQLGYPIDYCYSSPSYRAIQTANKILESQGRQAVPISIEPGIKK